MPLHLRRPREPRGQRERSAPWPLLPQLRHHPCPESASPARLRTAPLKAQRWQIPMTTAVPGFSTSSGNRSAMIFGLWRRKNAEPAQNRELRRALDKPADRARRARRDAESRAGVRAASPARSCGPAGAGTAPCRCERRGFSLYQRYFRLEGWTRGASRMLPGPTVNGWAN